MEDPALGGDSGLKRVRFSGFGSGLGNAKSWPSLCGACRIPSPEERSTALQGGYGDLFFSHPPTAKNYVEHGRKAIWCGVASPGACAPRGIGGSARARSRRPAQGGSCSRVFGFGLVYRGETSCRFSSRMRGTRVCVSGFETLVLIIPTTGYSLR